MNDTLLLDSKLYVSKFDDIDLRKGNIKIRLSTDKIHKIYSPEDDY